MFLLKHTPFHNCMVRTSFHRSLMDDKIVSLVDKIVTLVDKIVTPVDKIVTLVEKVTLSERRRSQPTSLKYNKYKKRAFYDNDDSYLAHNMTSLVY